MSHDIEASYAAIEVVDRLLKAPADCFTAPPPPASLSGYATREGRHQWPHADGVIEIVTSAGGTAKTFRIALEFKRPNEGLHGVLTAMGQSHAYLHKGYSASVIVIPSTYPGFSGPGSYVKEVLDSTSKAGAIGVISYAQPDMTRTSPFAGKLTVHRRLQIDPSAAPTKTTAPPATKTQWAHVREGSTDPDAFFRYLQTVKQLSGGITVHSPTLPAGLASAVSRLAPGVSANKWLSNTRPH